MSTKARSVAGYEKLKSLSKALKGSDNYEDKLAILLSGDKGATLTSAKGAKWHFFFLCLEMIGQHHVAKKLEEVSPQAHELLQDLEALDHFFASVGGLLGYQACVLELLEGTASRTQPGESLTLPSGIDVEEESAYVRALALKAIRSQGQFCELFPIGGAADRLNAEAKTGIASASFSFFGKTLLTRLIEDVQSREYLYFKLEHAQVTTPLFFMVSEHKEHAHQIRDQLENTSYFNRPKASITLGLQPLVPLFDEQGLWCLDHEGRLDKKPGGHGMLWSVAKESGWLEGMQALGKQKMLIRQINNPIANTDFTLIAFQGLGLDLDAKFAIAGCVRDPLAKEGVCVIKEGPKGRYLTNIEYCDKSIKALDYTAKAAANTNILFADLEAIGSATEQEAFPGKLLNFRFSSDYNKPIARLETMMQNISEQFLFDSSEVEPSAIACFKRSKTISCTKKLPDEADIWALETPSRALKDMMDNSRELLENVCDSQLPARTEGIDFLFSYHPALGPLYAIIGQKIQGLKLARYSHVELEIAEISLNQISVAGSLLIKANQVMGHLDEEGVLIYSDKTGQCVLEEVRVENQGLDFSDQGSLWKKEKKPQEALEIILEGHSRFIAKGVHFRGGVRVTVPDGIEMRASQDEKGHIHFTTEPIKEGAFYVYQESEQSAIKVSRA